MLVPVSALIGLASVARLVVADWNYSNSTFAPTTGKLNPNKSADVSDDVYDRLKNARGYVDRLNYLASQNDTDLFKFNFNPVTAGATASRGAGGLAVLADSTTAPVLVNTGVAMAMGFLEPCGVNAPHFHPFATQLVAVVSGGPLTAGAIWSNAATREQFTTTVHTYEMVALPQGSVHYVFNDNCAPAITANAFSSEDPGILNIAPTLFKFDADILNGTLGYPHDLDGYDPTGFEKHVPPSYVLGSLACLKRCGINQSVIGTPPA